MVDTKSMTEGSRCPYRSICPQEYCPGDSLEGEYFPTDSGFRLTEEGILCVYWDVLIPKDRLSTLRIPEGRHTAGLDTADKIDATRRKYGRSFKRREAQRRYENTEGGKKTTEKHLKSEKAKLSRQKYYYTEKGQDAHSKSKLTKKLFRGAAKWLSEHPGKTLDDYLKETTNEG